MQCDLFASTWTMCKQLIKLHKDACLPRTTWLEVWHKQLHADCFAWNGYPQFVGSAESYFVTYVKAAKMKRTRSSCWSWCDFRSSCAIGGYFNFILIMRMPQGRCVMDVHLAHLDPQNARVVMELHIPSAHFLPRDASNEPVKTSPCIIIRVGAGLNPNHSTWKSGIQGQSHTSASNFSWKRPHTGLMSGEQSR